MKLKSANFGIVEGKVLKCRGTMEALEKTKVICYECSRHVFVKDTYVDVL